MWRDAIFGWNEHLQREWAEWGFWRRNQQEKNQAGFGGFETNLPLQATLPTRPEQVLHSLKCQKFPAIFLRKTIFLPSFWKISRYFLPVQATHKHDAVKFWYFYWIFFLEISLYFLPVQAAHKDRKSVQFFLKNKRYYLVIWSWFTGKGCVFQPG